MIAPAAAMAVVQEEDVTVLAIPGHPEWMMGTEITYDGRCVHQGVCSRVHGVHQGGCSCVHGVHAVHIAQSAACWSC